MCSGGADTTLFRSVKLGRHLRFWKIKNSVKIKWQLIRTREDLEILKIELIHDANIFLFNFPILGSVVITSVV